MSSEIQNTECCPKFDPTPWDGKVFEWNNKKFIKDSVITQFYMPINFGEVIMRMNDKVMKSGCTNARLALFVGSYLGIEYGSLPGC
jgi:hypothetical protein